MSTTDDGAAAEPAGDPVPDGGALPDEVRVPLHELHADAAYLFGRVAADGSMAGQMVSSVRTKLANIEAAIKSTLPAILTYNKAKRPKGNNADEWLIYIQEWGPTPMVAVQIAEAIDDAAARVVAAPPPDPDLEAAIDGLAPGGRDGTEG